jgi:hypothetical protein
MPKRKHPGAGDHVLEAHMRTASRVVLVVIGILISVMVPSNKTAAIADARDEGHNVAVFYGLHVAIPDDMKTFPAELVPLP